MRIVTGTISHETHVLSNIITGLDEFRKRRLLNGDELFDEFTDTKTPAGGIIDGCKKHGFELIPIMSYAAKYCSAYYGPFREAADSAPKFGDRRTYQMDPSNAVEAIREVTMDIEEGADIIMVKPALPYLDIIYRVRLETDLPLAAYNVSGEFSMIKAAEKMGWVDGTKVMLETLTAIKRAGADMILTYFAMEAAQAINR